MNSEFFQVKALTFVQADKPKHKKREKRKNQQIFKHLRSITYLKTIMGKYFKVKRFSKQTRWKTDKHQSWF